jgi:hypothetical protein
MRAAPPALRAIHGQQLIVWVVAEGHASVVGRYPGGCVK